MTDGIEVDPERIELNAAKLVIAADDLASVANKPEVCSIYSGIDTSWTNEFHSALQSLTAMANRAVLGTQARSLENAQALRETQRAFEEQENANIDDFKFFEANTASAPEPAAPIASSSAGQPGTQPPAGKRW